MPVRSDAAFKTGLWDNAVYLDGDPSVRDYWFDWTTYAGTGIVRFDVVWSQVAPTEPTDPTDPADPAYDFSAIDAAIQDATSRGLDVLLTVAVAPQWAEGPSRPSELAGQEVKPGTWDPDRRAFAEFGRAVAERYSGSFAGLPRVRYFEAWNEPNHGHYFLPQFENGKPVAADLYRRMLNAFYTQVKDVHRSNVVVTGGLAPYGGEGYRTAPLSFFRQLLCLNKRLRREKCAGKPRFDVLAHHPINTTGGPRYSAADPDDVSTPDLKHVRDALRAAEREGTIAGKRKRHPLWATEIWWESNPPDPNHGVDPMTHARRVQEAIYLLWKQGAKVVINYVLVDAYAATEAEAVDKTYDSGLFYSDGTMKPAFWAFRFPFVAERISRGKITVWGKPPVGGQLVIERNDGGTWRELKGRSVKAGRVFTAQLPLKGPAELRARIGGETSLVWSQGG